MVPGRPSTIFHYLFTIIPLFVSKNSETAFGRPLKIIGGVGSGFQTVFKTDHQTVSQTTPRVFSEMFPKRSRGDRPGDPLESTGGPKDAPPGSPPGIPWEGPLG